jgi:hypothetical protein
MKKSCSSLAIPLTIWTGLILAAAGEKNLASEYSKKPGQKKDEYKIERIVVLRRGTAPVIDENTTQAALEAMAKRDREYRELFAQMDKEGNKIARALKEYKDPGTSPERKIKLRTFLRQTSVDNPEDKKLLKGASLDPQYKEILSEMHIVVAAVLFTGHGIANAWWSVSFYDLAESRHFHLGQAAISLVAVNESQYPGKGTDLFSAVQEPVSYDQPFDAMNERGGGGFTEGRCA